MKILVYRIFLFLAERDGLAIHSIHVPLIRDGFAFPAGELHN